MTEAQRIAGLGMDRARELLRPGVTAHELATEITYAMMRAGAERTSTPIYINFGARHLHAPRRPQRGAPAGRRARGHRPHAPGRGLLREPRPDVRPGRAGRAPGEADRDVPEIVGRATGCRCDPASTVARLDDAVAGDLPRATGSANTTSTGSGTGSACASRRPPASTIIPPHRNVPLREGMTVTIGHPVLAIPGFGGVRFEDVLRVTASGARPLSPYPIDPIVRA